MIRKALSFTYLFLILFSLSGIDGMKAEEKEKVTNLLVEHRDLIMQSAERFNLPPRLVASVIYTERTLNVNWLESELDMLLAKTGYSSSIGMGQVKIHTAQWIEKKIWDTESDYYLGAAYRKFIPKSKDREELINRLKEPRWNLNYIASYLAMFCKRWKDAGYGIENRPDIIGTLYSLGPFRVSDKKERKPHGNPRPNHFGIVVKRFYDSQKLLDFYPADDYVR